MPRAPKSKSLLSVFRKARGLRLAHVVTASATGGANAIGVDNRWNHNRSEEKDSGGHCEQCTFHGVFLLDPKVKK
jgi:hypothetical protein